MSVVQQTHQSHVTIGWLYRWVTGDSRPPDEAAVKRKQRGIRKGVGHESHLIRVTLMPHRVYSRLLAFASIYNSSVAA